MSIFFKENPQTQQQHQEEEEEEEEEEESRHIPQILLEEILIISPVRDLARWKLVSKAWGQLISNQELFQRRNISHLLISSFPHRPHPHLIIDLHKYDNNGKETKKIANRTLQNPPGIKPGLEVHYLASSEGLVCLRSCATRQTVILNPETRKAISLHDCMISIYWFGRHPFTRKFLFLAVENRRFVNIIYLSAAEKLGPDNFSLDSVHYRQEYDHDIVRSDSNTGILLHNFIHWPGCRSTIHTYDLENYTKGAEIPIPGCALENHPRKSSLANLSGFLLAMFKNQRGWFELWVMEKYRVQESWTKHWVIVGFDYLLPLGFPRIDCLILDSGRQKIVMCNLSKKHEKQHAKVLREREWMRSQAIMYTESLLSPEDIFM